MEKKNKEIIAARLRELREIRGVTQEKVREFTGIDVSNYETCKHLPGIETLTKLSYFFEVDISIFFGKR